MRADRWCFTTPAEVARERRAAVNRVADAVRAERELADRFARSARPTVDFEAIDAALSERRDAEAVLGEWSS